MTSGNEPRRQPARGLPPFRCCVRVSSGGLLYNGVGSATRDRADAPGTSPGGKWEAAPSAAHSEGDLQTTPFVGVAMSALANILQSDSFHSGLTSCSPDDLHPLLQLVDFRALVRSSRVIPILSGIFPGISGFSPNSLKYKCLHGDFRRIPSKVRRRRRFHHELFETQPWTRENKPRRQNLWVFVAAGTARQAHPPMARGSERGPRGGER